VPVSYWLTFLSLLLLADFQEEHTSCETIYLSLSLYILAVLCMIM